MTHEKLKELSKFFAHSANGKEQEGVPELMRDHIHAVTERAVQYAKDLGLENDAKVAALLHDLGKYTERFLQRLNGELPGLDHSSAGAFLALYLYKFEGRAASFVIQGHHVGLQRATGTLDIFARELKAKMESDQSTGSNLKEIVRLFHADGFQMPKAPLRSAIPWQTDVDLNHASEMLDVRMLFSTLVDADYIETEAHFEGDATCPRRPREDGLALDAEFKLNLVLEAIRRRREEVKVTEAVSEMRNQLQKDCLLAAQGIPGIFTLTAPTGSGKTLSMLAFALAHAAKYGLRRIIIVIPFLSIIEQTARIIREIFHGLDPLVVLEDHSASPFFDSEKGEDNEKKKHRLRNLFTENWDAPIVITTSVNALESLHAHDPRRCRKLHHLAKSVILFDEVQTLPPSLAEVTLGTLSRLSHRYNSTVVFSTATQPAFEYFNKNEQIKKLSSSDWAPKEIVQDVGRLFSLASDRYRVSWRLNKTVGWQELSSEILSEATEKPVIAIVNVKTHAVKLMRTLQALDSTRKLLHLSTNMCPMHREEVLKEARALLEANKPFVLVSTQCIEAGVDISAPVVFRAIGPLEAIAQAAGRCNRNGTDPVPGWVIVFVPEEEDYPPGAYRTAAQLTKLFLKNLSSKGVDIEKRNILSDPGILWQYYQNFYDSKGQVNEVSLKLKDALWNRDFREVSQVYRLINEDTINILVPYDLDKYERLLQQIVDVSRISRQWVREARSMAVSIQRSKVLRDAAVSFRPILPSEEWHEAEWFILQGAESEKLYDRTLLGLLELPNFAFV